MNRSAWVGRGAAAAGVAAVSDMAMLFNPRGAVDQALIFSSCEAVGDAPGPQYRPTIFMCFGNDEAAPIFILLKLCGDTDA